MIKSKTMWFAFVIDALAVIQLNAEELRAAIPPEYYGWFLIAVGIGIKFFRAITTKPLKEK
ncbi:MAG: hypothetical protein GWN13_02850 [Phycisphaerae bacterium]|nr:hypothetical protein [Phycisphaerae bacterium]